MYAHIRAFFNIAVIPLLFPVSIHQEAIFWYSDESVTSDPIITRSMTLNRQNNYTFCISIYNKAYLLTVLSTNSTNYSFESRIFIIVSEFFCRGKRWWLTGGPWICNKISARPGWGKATFYYIWDVGLEFGCGLHLIEAYTGYATELRLLNFLRNTPPPPHRRTSIVYLNFGKLLPRAFT